MKVLHLVEYLYLGGIERLLEQLARYTSHDQGELLFFAYEMEKEDGLAKDIRLLGRKTFLCKKGPGYDRKLLLKLIEVIRSEKIEVIHTHDFGPMEYALPLKSRFPSLRLIHTQHTLHHFIPRLKYRLFYQLASYFYDQMVAVSSSVEEVLREKCPWAKGNLQTIYNGVNETLFTPTAGLLETDKGTSPLLPLRLVNVSRLSSEKNFLCILKACVLLKQQGIPFVLHHAGTGQNHFEESLRTFIKDEGLQQDVHLHGMCKDVRPLLAQADFFISPSFTEGHPVAVLEALSSGLVCLCSDIPAHRNISTQIPFYFDPHNPQSLFELLKSLIHLPPERQQLLRRKGRELVEAKFSLSRMIDQYTQLYFRALKTKTYTKTEANEGNRRNSRWVT